MTFTIKKLEDLNNFRSAPLLSLSQKKLLLHEITKLIVQADWLTVGIMASSSDKAITVITTIQEYFKWPSMNIVSAPLPVGPVYLKANQKTKDIYMRIEHGLGEGIIICCHYFEESSLTNTYGPLPLNLFDEKPTKNS